MVIDTRDIAKFEIGDFVRIRSDLDSNYDVPFHINDMMEMCRGKEYTVVSIPRRSTYEIGSFPYVIDFLKGLGIVFDEDVDDIRVDTYILEDMDGNRDPHSWNIFMFDIDTNIPQYDLENLDVLFT